MMRRLLSLLLFLLSTTSLQVAARENVTYTKEDSLRVVELLRLGAAQPEGANLMLFYAQQFVGRPYVAHTLEGGETERLAVNLRQLDCTTLVETVCALTLTTRHGSLRWHDFLHWLQTIRYRDGRMDGYCSRNHYFSQWIQSNERLGLVREVSATDKASPFPFTAQQTIRLHYMSRHPDAYPILSSHPEELQTIRLLEQEASNRVVRYIPVSLLGKTKRELNDIHDGDILAIVTKKDGLDVSHLGLAVWAGDGLLHLLNASSIHKQVVLEPMTLRQYMLKHPSQLGVRVIRLL